MQHPVNPVTLNFAPRRHQEAVELGKLDGGPPSGQQDGIPCAYGHIAT